MLAASTLFFRGTWTAALVITIIGVVFANVDESIAEVDGMASDGSLHMKSGAPTQREVGGQDTTLLTQKKSITGEYIIKLRVAAAARRPILNMKNITIVTHATLDRLPHIVRWCKMWRGPMSLSLFIKEGQTASEVVDTVVNSHPCVKTHVDIHTVEVDRSRFRFNSEDDTNDMFSYYPFNVQRNAALDGALGQWVFLLDIDFKMIAATSEKPHRQLLEKRMSAKFHSMLEQHKEIMGAEDVRRAIGVIPAVETVNKDVDPPTNIKELRQQIQKHEVAAFYGHHCKNCHMPTRIDRFASVLDRALSTSPTAQEDDVDAAVAALNPYRVQYAEGYEPYVIMHRLTLPRYDERFVGRGWDKMSFFYELESQSKAATHSTAASALQTTPRHFVVLVPLGVFLLHHGRGDVPKAMTKQYLERQRENAMLMNNFKAEMIGKYDLPKKTLENGDDPFKINDIGMEEVHNAQGDSDDSDKKNPSFKKANVDKAISWSEVSLSIQAVHSGQGCVSRFRGVELENNETRVKGLEEALSFACSVIDCSPLRPGGVRYYPNTLSQHADWAFDRYLHYAAERGEDPHASCHFNGYGKLVSCMKECFGCVARPTASKQRIADALKWVCDPKVLGNCEAILAIHPLRGAHKDEDGAVKGNYTLHQKAALLFSYYYQIHRCTMLDPLVGCFFDGAGMRVPCGRIPV